jgi:uncharacterized protein involved in exopolysaccharide biosynthesis/Mrp family chromosome partitioning ATPase
MNNEVAPNSVPFPAASFQSLSAADADVPVGGVFETVLRRKLLVLTISVLIIVITAIVVFRLPAYYKSTAVLLIDSQRAQSLSQVTTGESPQIDMVAVKTQVSIIQSPNLAERVVKELDLIDAPEFVNELNAPRPLFRRWIEQAESLLTGAAPEQDVPLTPEQRIKTVAGMLLGKVSASNDGKSYLIEISAQAFDGALSARIANAFANIYLDFNRKLKIDAITEANSRFFDQLPPLAEKVRDADRTVQTFRVSHGLTPATTPGQVEGHGATLADEQLAQVNVQLGDAINERAEKEAKLQQITDAQHGKERLEAIPEIVASGLIQTLRQRQAVLSSEAASLATSALQSNPGLIAIRAAQINASASISAEIARLAASAASAAATARSKETALRDRLNDLRDIVASQSEAEIKLRDLQNQADAAREVYLSYLHRFQQTASLGVMQQPDAELIALADLPLHSAGPRRMQIVMLASAIGVIIAVLCALTLDRMRRGFYTLADLEAATGLTVIGFIPRLRRGLEEMSSRKTQVLFREAINHVRATLEFGNQQYRARVVLVTSALPMEGKTHFAASLARSVAVRGGRALLISCDGKSQSFSKMLSLVKDGQAPMFDEAGDRSPESNLPIIPGAMPGLDVARLQTSVTYPSFMPSLNRARVEMDEARGKYDLIVLDGPPVLACAEAELLCGVVDGVIMVVRWGQTTKGALSSALRTMSVYGVRLLGAVLNNADIKQLSRSSDEGNLYRRYID